jgi:colicin import membrane protein
MARRRDRLQKPKSNVKAWVLAVVLHVVVITALVIGFRWPSITGQDTDVIQAVTVDSDKQQQEEQKKKEEEERKRKAAEERKRKEAEQRRLAEQRKREEQARKRQEAEAQRKLVKERKRKEAEEQRKAEAERQRLEQETKRLTEERQRIEQERQRLEQQRQERERAAEEERKRKEAEKQLSEAMAAEERERQEAARRARALTAAEKYKILIRQKVSRNWVRPPGAAKGLQCTVKVRLAASGDVLTVAVTQSSGNDLFDRSVENAVLKASPLPLPEEKDLFDYFRDIEFLFNPEA